MFFTQYQLLLASQSPRRHQLLLAAGIAHTIIQADVEESWPLALNAADVAVYLAEKKAMASASALRSQQDIILAADSTVVLGDEVLNKPLDVREAQEMLRKLSGQGHEVITGVCLLSLSQKRCFSVKTTVFFDELSEAEITHYIEHFRPFDKAGSYAIQEWIGLCKVNRIEGDYYNVMGLPVQAVYRQLATWDKKNQEGEAPS
jgi:septum formation protein